MKKVKRFSILLAVLAVVVLAATLPMAISAIDNAAPTQITAYANESISETEVMTTADETPPVVTAETQENVDNSTGMKALAAGIAIGFAALGAAIGMGIAIAKSNEAISRQPEAEDKIRGSMMLGLIFIETIAIYALIVAILVIFVL